MKKQKKLWVVGNWKMYGSLSLVKEFLSYASNYSSPANVEIAVCFPHPFLILASKARIQFGAQDLCHLSSPAATGGVSSNMLASLKCDLVLIGHSERRKHFAEDNDAILMAKLKKAEEADLIKIFCIGEKIKSRWKDELSKQLKPVLSMQHELSKLIIAYEPVWAIGGDKESASSTHLKNVTEFVRSKGIKDHIIYGGSVNSSNLKSIIPFVDGVLVGSASRHWPEFRDIIEKSSILAGAP